MIELVKKDLNFKILTREWKFLEAVNEHFSSYADGYQFHPKYLAGVWNGKVFLMKDKSLPYGVLGDFIKFWRKNYSHISLKISDELKEFVKFNEDISPINYDGLIFTPAIHQREAVEVALKFRMGIIRAATAAGKSLIMFLILRHLREQKSHKKFCIIVPNTLLVGQLYSNFVEEYGLDSSLVGRVYSKYKEWDKEIVISTWQTLKNNPEKLFEFDSVFVDETHQAKAYQLAQILQKMKNATIRLGFTGTLPDDEYNKWCIKSYLGPVLIDISVDELQQNGWLSQCVIKWIQIYYKDFKKQFKIENTDKKTMIQIANEINALVFKSPFRLYILKKYLNNIKSGAALLLVGKVETEGKFLKEYLEQYYPDREIVFISGGTNETVREEYRQRCKDPNCKIILIATYPIFQAGVDIPALAHVFLVAPFKSKIRVLQSIGRALRKHASKEKNGARVYDLVDTEPKFNMEGGDIRRLYYEREKFEIEEIIEKES